MLLPGKAAGASVGHDIVPEGIQPLEPTDLPTAAELAFIAGLAAVGEAPRIVPLPTDTPTADNTAELVVAAGIAAADVTPAPTPQPTDRPSTAVELAYIMAAKVASEPVALPAPTGDVETVSGEFLGTSPSCFGSGV